MAKNRGNDAGKSLERPYGPSAIKLPDTRGTVVMNDAEIIFPNFKGAASEFNAEGDRNFCVVLDPDIAEYMMEDGWNIKKLKDREDSPGDYYMQVSVKHRNRDGDLVRPPKIWVVSSNGRTDLGEHEVDILDFLAMQRVDVIIAPYHYNIRGEKGIKAYLQTMAVVKSEDYLELKYAEVPMAGQGAEPLAIEQGGQTPGTDEDEDIVDADFTEG